MGQHWVQAAPLINTQPVAVTALEGRTASFSVVASGYPNVTYQWQRNGISLPGATASVLNLDNVKPSDAADYRVLVSNSLGLVASNSVRLTVNPLPSITTQPASVSVLLNDPVTLSVVASSYTAATYQWFKNGVAISTAKAATFTLTKSVATDAANYYVVVTNPAGSVTSATASITVVVAPTITAQPVSLSVNEGDPFTLSITATGSPSYQWRRNGTTIIGATSAEYKVDAASQADAGTYTVGVSNLANKDTPLISVEAIVTVIPRGLTARHSIVGRGFAVDGTLTITNTLTHGGDLGVLGWDVVLPAGWTFVSSSGSVGEIGPVAGEGGTISWAWLNIPNSPLTFTYTIKAPAAVDAASVTIPASASLWLDSGKDLIISPAPLVVPKLTYHTADINQDYQLSLIELMRVVELYATSNLGNRTGAYKTSTTTQDKFAPDNTKTLTGAITLTSYHSSDYGRDGRISLAELLRTIQLYSTRSGSIRTGSYREEKSTVDGFAPGLAP